MELTAHSGDAGNLIADLFVLWVFDGEDIDAPWLPVALAQSVQALADLGDLGGKEPTVLPTAGALKSTRVALVPMGQASAVTLQALRAKTADLARLCMNRYGERMVVADHKALYSFKAAQVGAAIAEGAVIGSYRFDRRFSSEPGRRVLSAKVHAADKERIPGLKVGLAEGAIIGEAVNLGKDLANEPANHMTPTLLADAVKKAAKGLSLKVTVYNEEWLKKQGFELLTTVSAGSEEPCRLILMEHAGGKPEDPWLAIVGKGVTFDSGGISLKPPRTMARMKRDMTGGANAIAAMIALAQLKPEANILGLVPATENLPDGKAYKPGDVLTSLSGITVEIHNTDAEGRLALADAMTWIQGERDLIGMVDMATLTGGAQHATGDQIAPFLSCDDRLSDLLREAAEATGELFWELPLHQGYLSSITGPTGDLRNASDKPPSLITAALFLQRFVGDDLPWMHWDIAAVSAANSDHGLLTKGASGVTIRTLIELARKVAAHPDRLTKPS